MKFFCSQKSESGCKTYQRFLRAKIWAWLTKMLKLNRGHFSLSYPILFVTSAKFCSLGGILAWFFMYGIHISLSWIITHPLRYLFVPLRGSILLALLLWLPRNTVQAYSFFFREIIFSWKPKPVPPLLSPKGSILCCPSLSPQSVLYSHHALVSISTNEAWIWETVAWAVFSRKPCDLDRSHW